jgi:phospholipid/cholesterol/gamma-HCH transport system permease protein
MTSPGSSPPIRKDKKGLREQVSGFFIGIFNTYRFILRFFRQAVAPPYEFKEIIRQSYSAGIRSIGLITLTSFITGIVFTKQSRPSLADFGASSWLPSLVGLAVVRALAPLITGLVIAGKVGSNIGAELGSMKVSEQIEAMEVSGTNPFKYLVVTRVMAITCILPILIIYSAFISLVGSYINVHVNELTSVTAFINDAFSQISLLDLISFLIKAIAFGFTIGITGCYMGFTAEKGTVGVGRAANSSVVYSMFFIFIEEIIIVQIINAMRGY